MNDKIRIYVEKLFTDAPRTKKIHDLREELIYNLTDKYNDLIATGQEETAAYNSVISGIGDVNELIASVADQDVFHMENEAKQRKQSAFIVSICVGLYILSLLSAIVLDQLLDVDSGLSAVVLFLIAGVATCILIYHFMSRPKYTKAEGSVVEEFKEWNADQKRNKEVEKAITSVLWTVTVAVYLIASFVFGIWPYSWLIFIIAAAVNAVINAIFQLRR